MAMLLKNGKDFLKYMESSKKMKRSFKEKISTIKKENTKLVGTTINDLIKKNYINIVYTLSLVC